MTKDTEWGPWIGWNGGERPVGLFQKIEGIFHNGDRLMRIEGIGDDFFWNDHPYVTIAYRVKKEPVVEVKRETSRIELYGSIPKEIVNNAFYHGLLVTIDLECTYTDGNLTKIHWEADQ